MLYRKIKKLIFITFGVSLCLIILSPYLVTYYVEYRYKKVIKLIENLTPGIKVNHYIRYGYTKSLIVSKIQIAHDAWTYDPNWRVENNLINYTPHKIITLQNQIIYSPFSYNFAVIKTKVLTGLPKFIKEQKDLKISTFIDYKGNINAKIENLEIQHILQPELNKLITLQQARIYLNDENQNLHINFKVPKVIYQENLNKTEIENLNFDFKIRDYNNPEKIRIKFLTELDRLYLIEKSKLILKLANFNMEQRFSNTLSNKISFLKLNILNHKFGPLASKLQINNLSLSRLIENFEGVKLPFNKEEITGYKLINFANSLLKYKPSFSTDLLLYIGNEKLNLLSDYIIDSQNADWLDLNDISDSLSINIFVRIPKQVATDLLANFLTMQQNRNYSKELKNLKSNVKDQKYSKIRQKELDDLVVEKIQYLLKHNIIKEEDNSFIVNLSISEGTFYSRMNPFKIFSF